MKNFGPRPYQKQPDRAQKGSKDLPTEKKKKVRIKPSKIKIISLYEKTVKKILFWQFSN